MTGSAPFPRPARRATLKDVALAAGVSQSTTSRAISGEGYVAAAVRERVLSAAAELRYVPDAMARSLRRQVSSSVGVLVSDLRSPFQADLAAGIARSARDHGFTMTLADDQGSAEEELAAAHAFVAARAAGVIVTPLSKSVGDYLLAQRVPVVEVGRRLSGGACDAVVVDDRDVVRRLAQHLIALGHRRVALLADGTGAADSSRLAGYRAALLQAGAGSDGVLVVTGGWMPHDVRRRSVDLLGRADRPTAVCAADSRLAEGLWRAAGDLGLRIPEDLSLVCFEDVRWMSMVSPGLTAIAQDAAALGEAAMRRLVARLRDPAGDPVVEVLGAELCARGSTAAPRTG